MLTSRRIVLFLLVTAFLSIALPSYAQNFYLSNQELYKPPGDNCTWVSIDPHPWPGAQAYLQIDSGATYWPEGQNCIDEYWAEGWHSITAVVYDWPDWNYQEWYSVYGEFTVHPPPPYIETASKTGDNWDWVRLTGALFQPDSYVVVYSYDWSYFQTYSGLNVSPDGLSLSFYLADGTLRHSFGWDGIHIQVINNGVGSNWALAQAPQPSISSGGPACADFYCIQLNGVFPLNAYVDFRIPGQSELLQDYADLVVTGSQITLRLNPSLRYVYDTTGLNAWAVNPSLTNGSNAYYLAPVDRRVTGFIEGISQQGSNYFLYGWACAKTYPGSIDVHVYVGGPAGGGGAFAFSGTANLASDAGIAAACNSTGSNYRFWLQIPQAVMAQYGGQQIYVHGISPFGLANLVIGNSGNVTIPGAPVISLKEYIYLGDRVLAVETTNQ